MFEYVGMWGRYLVRSQIWLFHCYKPCKLNLQNYVLISTYGYESGRVLSMRLLWLPFTKSCINEKKERDLNLFSREWFIHLLVSNLNGWSSSTYFTGCYLSCKHYNLKCFIQSRFITRFFKKLVLTELKECCQYFFLCKIDVEGWIQLKLEN